MNDRDADEIVKQRKGGERMPLVDKSLIAAGITLAGLATIFPWYAFFNQDKFAMPALWQGSTRDLPEKVGSPGAPTDPMAMRSQDEATRRAVDDIVTATVTPAGADAAAPVDSPDQPFPSSTGFKLVHVAKGRALIEDASGMYVVRIGSTLPDNSRLATLEERGGRWVLITSNGDVFRAD